MPTFVFDKKLVKTPDDRDLEFNFVYLYSQYNEMEKVDDAWNREKNWQGERDAIAPLIWSWMGRPDSWIRKECKISTATLGRAKKRSVNCFVKEELCFYEGETLSDAEIVTLIQRKKSTFDKALKTRLCDMGWREIDVRQSLSDLYHRNLWEICSEPGFWEQD